MNYLEQIKHQAEQTFGNKEKADAWLNQPKKLSVTERLWSLHARLKDTYWSGMSLSE
ncbi:hypothetical protein QN386_08060 [Pseudomonas sp. CCI3.2]|nr:MULTISPECIES: hypothetical protein [unclassified Pseudomonas]MEA9977353.1 hypothetical protein [Pseudomonas sp. RTS4]MEA9993195.1 hypothetical protein [Pseudomonas sp. AA4]MEB0101278.1 hypothetical protein [Pseudomonas sp. CCI3.2]MEB0131385.1 hypothetical protein [Pseudomonas sp. CCI2.4]MEB0151916.1 hypothetical protein [Pseudomonas sp. CCC4.3]MEB0218088.1 hypothetical protein [Pseudomonas sp. AB12(2023)]MEB0245273.1 hypothetical protein [Pseudomonas sp. 10S5]